MHSIATAISYCTNDYRFLKKCVEEAKKFSRQIVIVTGDRLFSGESEDHALLRQTYEEFPECTFVEFAHTKDRLYSRYINRSPQDNDWFDFWHSTTRYIPFFFIDPACDYLLFLDSDEIIDAERFLPWLDTGEYKNYDAMRFLQYYYFREARFRSKLFQIGGLFAKKSSLQPSLLMSTDDRCGIFHAMPGKKWESASFQGKPMIHHYSWVKTKEECLIKIRNWGHAWEKDWKTLVEEEFSREFQGKDFEGRSYTECKKVYFDPFKVNVVRKETKRTEFPHVKKVTPQEIDRKEIEFSFGI